MFGTQTPIIQAPMAGACGSSMVIAVCEAGAMGSLPCALLSPEQIDKELGVIRKSTAKPVNVNFFCHDAKEFDLEREKRWSGALTLYYQQLGITPSLKPPSSTLNSFNSDACAVVEQYKPEVVSFHFGLPDNALLERVKLAGCKVISTATTVEEALWLEKNGCDAIIAQGLEAGGHRGMFLSENVHSQMGLISLLPQVVDAVNIPVIAAGGIADGRGMAAAFSLGASMVQIGTAYLSTSQALISEMHRQAINELPGSHTALTNLFSGKPARSVTNRIMRELGPLSDQVPEFPFAGNSLAPLKSASESAGSTDFSSLWSGQSGGLNRQGDAGDITRQIMREAQTCCTKLTSTLTL